MQNKAIFQKFECNYTGVENVVSSHFSEGGDTSSDAEGAPFPWRPCSGGDTLLLNAAQRFFFFLPVSPTLKANAWRGRLDRPLVLTGITSGAD